MGEQWSSVCLWEHGQPDNISPYSSLGQNLWLGTGSLANEPDPIPAVQAWYNEDQYYDYETNGCSGVCGHYTQVFEVLLGDQSDFQSLFQTYEEALT